MPRIIISSLTITNTIADTIDSRALFEYLIRYWYNETETVLMSDSEMRRRWIGEWSRHELSLSHYKKQLPLKKRQKFEDRVLGLESEIKVRVLNWVVEDASGKVVAKRKEVEWGVLSTFKLQFSLPLITSPFIIEHDAKSYLITKES